MVNLYPCDICEFKGASTEGLKLHIKKIHTAEHKCNQCDFITSKAISLRRHKNLTHVEGINYQCSHENCDFVTKNRYSLRMHKRNKHEEKYQCGKCDFKTGYQFILRKHQKSKHSHRLDLINLLEINC